MNDVPFTDLISEIVDNRGRTCPVAAAGLPLIATNCISNERLYPSYDTNRWVSQETYATWFRGHPEPGDLIFVCKGSPGRVCLAPDPVDFCIAQDMVAVRPDSNRVYPRYLFAALRSPLVQERIANLHVGTLIPHFKKGDFEKLLVPIPSRETQRSIGDLYFYLSRKVEQNRRTALVLERAAQAIFRAWFVDFEPVKAKAEGASSFPSMPQDVFGSLPTTLVDSELGPVPEGWAVEPLASTATFLNGLALQKYPARGDRGDLRVIKIAELRRGSADNGDWANGEVPSEYVVDDGDLLFSWSGTLEAQLWFGGRGVLNQHLFKVTSSRFPTWLSLLRIRQHLAWFRLVAASKATTMGHIRRSHLHEALVVVPPGEVLEAADFVLGPLFRLFGQVKVESRNLASLRDFLLPRLMFGEIRVKDTAEVRGDF